MVPLSKRVTLCVYDIISTLRTALTFSQVALTHDMNYATVLGQLREARSQGLKAPVLLMGVSDENFRDTKF